MNVPTNDFYIVASQSMLNTLSYIYEDNFNPLNPSNNVLLERYTGCDNYQFKLGAYLHANKTYFVVVTTLHPTKTGNFAVIVSGRNKVRLTQNSKCLFNQFSFLVYKRIYGTF